VRELGAQILLTTTRIIGKSFNPLFRLIPTHFSADIVADADPAVRLTVLGPALIERWPDLPEKGSSARHTELAVDALREGWLSALPVPARSTATLLVLLARDLTGLTSPAVGDPLEQLWLPPTVRKELARLAVPEDVAQLVIQWVDKRSASRRA
jgi:hypothetical protein